MGSAGVLAMMDVMASKVHKSAMLILLIPSALVVAGLVWALAIRDLRFIAVMLLIAGALALGFVRARRARQARE
ncbi:hypothetical protein N801_18895 [Knoellia aerolata DSM 18566]|uniref:Uncharacterized protein n=1 Tax=Knoellia aerolata DSM 18566 TaxID=1385519 RepID=A0A0A0JVZ4_9MICO|nr:hypothetical protein N801_18895 [Knoellia aerolata DSM 18566]